MYTQTEFKKNKNESLANILPRHMAYHFSGTVRPEACGGGKNMQSWRGKLFILNKDQLLFTVNVYLCLTLYALYTRIIFSPPRDSGRSVF